MKWVYDDPSSRYFETHENDSISRSISIATGISYDRVQAMLDKYIERECLDDKYVNNSRLKLRKEVAPMFLKDLGYSWICKMQFSGGCKFHLKDGELPKDKTLIVNISKHFTCVKNGIIHDLYDPSRDGTRAVYGYYIKEGG